MKTCHSCAFSADDSYRFCPKCGASFGVEETIDVITCDNCGNDSPSASGFCVSCGNKLTGEKKQITVIRQPVEQKKHHQKGEKKNSSTKPKPEPVQEQGKQVPLKTILLVFLGLLLVGFAALYVGGVFNEPAPAVPAAVTGQDQNPGDGHQHVDLSMLQHINALETQLNAEPANMAVLLELAHAQNDAGFYDKAIANYKKYLAKDPKNTDVIVDMGVCFFNLKDYTAADSVMQSALKINPKHQICLFNLGVVNLNRGDMAKSKEWLQKCIDVNPNTEQAQKAKQLLVSH